MGNKSRAAAVERQLARGEGRGGRATENITQKWNLNKERAAVFESIERNLLFPPNFKTSDNV